ncbi:MAG TPA: META domain-containing protein [Flavipsychrobacter sp.]|nr:META domain-containing protein [Flavipsychrobacter sp.]
MKQILLCLCLLFAACSDSRKATTGSGPADTNTLIDKKWVLQTIAADTIALAKNPFIIFTADNKVNGFAGCNLFFGAYSQQDNKLKISDLGSTKMACKDDYVEPKFMQFLGEVDHFAISGDRLILYKGEFSVITFVATAK